MWNHRRAAAVLVSVLVVLCALPPLSAARYTQRSRRVAPGVWFTRIADRQGPNQLRLLTIDPSGPAGIEVAMGRLSRLGRATTSRIAAANRALAAVNGDFFETNGRMLHAFVEDASLRQSHVQVGWSFTMSSRERPAIVRPDLRIEATPLLPGSSFPIARWNVGLPAWGEVVAYGTAARGVASPPRNGCTARLLPSGSPSWSDGADARLQDYRIDAVRCSEEPLRYRGGLVLGSRSGGAGADWLRSLLPLTTLRLSWSFGAPAVREAIGGMPVLVRDGANVAPSTCWSPGFCARNPRTGVGVTPDGRVLLLTVDGRQQGWSVGMTMVEFAQQFVRLGATWALNLDGGGSTTMVVRGDVKNRPSGGAERRVGSAILVTR